MNYKKQKFTFIETKLIDYVKLRAQTYKVEKYGFLWMMTKEKCLKWARDGNITNFQCSDGWMNKTLQRHGMTQMNLHGEVDDMTDKEVEALIYPCSK